MYLQLFVNPKPLCYIPPRILRREPALYVEFANVLVFALVAVGFALVNLTVGRILRRQRPYPEKLSTYECGEDTIGTAWIQFNPRFYIIALIFLIFDVEIAVLFPWTTIFKAGFQDPGVLLVEMLIFIAILVVGLAYVWVKGDLEWLKSLGEVRADEEGAPKR